MLGKKGIAIDDFIPLLVTMLIFVFAIVFLLTLAVMNSKSNDTSFVYDVTDIEFRVGVDQFLNKEVICGDEKGKLIDILATINTDIRASDREKLNCLRSEINPFFHERDWFLNFEVWRGETQVIEQLGTKPDWATTEIELPQGKIVFFLELSASD